ncbi:MAG: hypothetical protein ACREKE_01600 [bacterium]
MKSMRRKPLVLALCALCLAAAAPLAADGGTILPWLGGTQGWDTVPGGECDLGVLAQGGGGSASLGPEFQAGVLDTLQVQGQWLGSTGTGSQGNAGLRWREPGDHDRRPDFSAYAQVDFDHASWMPWVGLDLATADYWDSDFSLNAEADRSGDWRLRLGAWSPYLLPTLRLGAEASWLDASGEALTPQILVNAPGDISLQAGARLDPHGGPPLWILCLSYELFPSP